MTPGARIQETIELIDELMFGNHSADRLFARWFRKRRYAGSKDRAFIKNLMYAVLRNFHRLAWWMGGDASARSLTLAASILSGNANMEDLVGWCDGEKYRPRPLTSSEIQNLRKLKSGGGYLSPIQPDAVRCNLPEWLYDEAVRVFNGNVEQELAALNTIAPLDLRVNELKMNRDRAEDTLGALGIEVSKTKYAPSGLRLMFPQSIERLPLFKNGCIEIQDEGSQISAHLCSAQKCMNVLDFCAGAGGKSLALAAIMQNKGNITLCDIDQNRLNRALIRLRRAGANNYTLKTIDPDLSPSELSSMGVFDRVLLDAPCTGSGVWRRHPEGRFTLTQTRYSELTLLQGKLLKSTSRLVALHGQLIYATCSFLAEENEEQIEKFLLESDSFAVIPIRDVWRSAFGNSFPFSGDYMRLTPYHHGVDGFFAAVLKRIK